MRILREEKNVGWVPVPNSVELGICDELPPLHLCTSAYAFVFDADGRLLMADLDRGLDIPGGHLETAEQPVDAMRREVQEETGVVIGKAELFCVQKVILSGPKPENYAYPFPQSFQLLYFSTDFQVGTFLADEDSSGLRWVSEEDAKSVPWLQKNGDIYDYVRALFKKSCQHKESSLSSLS